MNFLMSSTQHPALAMGNCCSSHSSEKCISNMMRGFAQNIPCMAWIFEIFIVKVKAANTSTILSNTCQYIFLPDFLNVAHHAAYAMLRMNKWSRRELDDCSIILPKLLSTWHKKSTNCNVLMSRLQNRFQWKADSPDPAVIYLFHFFLPCMDLISPWSTVLLWNVNANVVTKDCIVDSILGIWKNKVVHHRHFSPCPEGYQIWWRNPHLFQQTVQLVKRATSTLQHIAVFMKTSCCRRLQSLIWVIRGINRSLALLDGVGMATLVAT